MRDGLVFNLQRYSVHDGPGIRTTVFLKGCPLRCGWCHNPEGISRQPEFLILENRCLGCGACRRACRFGALVDGQSVLPAHVPACVRCGACVDACPTQARQIAGLKWGVPELLDAVQRDRLFYDDSGGGVTFSGGEPLAQPEFLRAALLACRSVGLHTAVETCGLARTEDLLAIVPGADLFLYDLKLMDEAKHRQHTGMSNGLILENLLALGRAGCRIWIRVPVIPGINDSAEDLDATARFAATIPGVQRVDLLPYHRAGLQKSRRLGRTNPLANVPTPSAEAMAEAAEIFKNTASPPGWAEDE